MSNLLSDLRYALRVLRRSPLFAAVAISSLALGIGANTAIFSLIDQIVLRKLPIKDPDNLVMLYQRGSNMGSNMGDRMHSYPIYQDFQQKAEPLAEVLCRRIMYASISIDNQTERVEAEMVSGNYFTMLGVKPAIGRIFTSEEDDQVYGGHPVVVLSYGYWDRRFARDPNIVGKKILVNNYPMTVVGVSAENFIGLDPASSPQIRVPILMKSQMAPTWDWFNAGSRRSRWIQVFGRLKPGYTIQSAQASLQVLFHQIREYETTLPEAAKWSAYNREQFLKGTINLEKADTGYSDLRNSFSSALIVLMCMVGLVLLIACANVANLLIARAIARQKEITVRLSLGGSRIQLIRQLLLESMVLAISGGIAGVVLAFAMTRGLLGLIPANENPLLIRPQPDGRILLFTLSITVLTGLIFGLVPALRASRQDLWTTLKSTVGSIAGPASGSLFLRKGLIAVQVALSFLLLFGAGLFVRSLQNLRDKNTGFKDIQNLVTFQVSPAQNGYSDARAVVFYKNLLDNIRSRPGAKSAGFAAQAMLTGDEWDNTMSVEGHQTQDGEDMQAFMNALSPRYFEAMGIPIVEGRDFDDRDIRSDSTVAIVNQAFEKHFFGEHSALGRHIGNGGGPDVKLNIEIVGVVADSLYQGPREGVHRQVYLPKYGNASVAFYLRTNVDSQSTYKAIRETVKSLDPSMPVYDMKTLQGQLDETLLTERLIALLSAAFGLVATALAAIGLYGVMAFIVVRRTKELGVRLALGAQRTAVLWLVMKEVLTLMTIGLLIGVPSAIALGHFVSTQLYGIQGTDPWIATAMIIALTAVGVIAGLIPAGRASRIDPILALRFE